jgi:hypothetical protein
MTFHRILKISAILLKKFSIFNFSQELNWDKSYDAPKCVFTAPKKYIYRTKFDQKIFSRFNLTHQNNYLSKSEIFLAKKCLKRTNLLPHQIFLANQEFTAESIRKHN